MNSVSPIKLSAVIITLNEEKNIERCIESVQKVVEEVIVVDSFSTDATESICKRLGAKFIQNKFAGHIQQQNFARDQASYDYILSIDADEALSEKLQQSILQKKSNWDADAFTVNRLTNYCGQWIHHCGWYPDRKVRLWDRRKGEWGGENPHNKILIQPTGMIQQLDGDLLHYSFYSISQHIQTLNNFSEIAAREALKKNKKADLFIHVLLNPLFTFVKKYFFQLGFLDGYYGFVVCINSAYSNFAKYSKIYAAQKNN